MMVDWNIYFKALSGRVPDVYAAIDGAAKSAAE
jgi:hypothetical protein